ncbi:MAG: D-alanine--D-alanine ligase [Nocardioidaceae bacterium]
MRTRVAVVGGGESCEHEVSIASAAAIAAALDRDRYDVVALTIDPEGVWRDSAARALGLARAVAVICTCDVVIPAIHGPRGEDGTVAALCDLAHRPYVGSGLTAGAVAMDKWLTKLVANAAGIATAPAELLDRGNAATYRWTRPVVVKPVAAGSSHGVALVDDPAGLQGALAAAFALDDQVLVENLVEGREIDVAVLGRPDGGRLIAPMLEIVVPGIFGLDTKYNGKADFRVPAALDDVDRKGLEEAAVVVFDALGCAGVARVDFFLTEDGPILNEVNTMPGFTEHSQVPRMFAAAGMPYADLLSLLVQDALVAQS